MPETAVVYLVPVVVTLEDGEVTAVNVDDESIRPDPDAGNDPATLKLADEADWPAWEFGF